MKLRQTVTFFVCLLLMACAPGQRAGVHSLAPEEVLQRAAKATQSLESAQYVVQGDFESKVDTQSMLGTVRMDGMLQHAGEQLRFQLDVDTDIDDLSGASSVSGTVEVVMIAPDEVYMNIHALTSQPSSTLFQPDVIGKIAGSWWLLPSGDTPPVTGTVTPDPRLLQAQAQVVEVTKDRGVTTVNGRETYHYDVALNKDKLVAFLATAASQKGEVFDAQQVREDLEQLQASGQLWIDAEEFFLQKITWVLQSLPIGGGTASASLTVTFRNHNAAPPILPPSEFKPFTPAVFFSLPSDALFPEEVVSPADLSEPQIDQILQQLNSL